MSSGTDRQPYASTAMIKSSAGTAVAMGGLDAQDLASVPGLVLSARQLELNLFYSYYRCSNYDARKIDWNGNPVGTHIERDAIATQGYIPPGFVDAGQKTLPLKFRRPSAPFYVSKVVVNRFSALLFGEGRCPTIHVKGDPQRESYLRAIAKEGKLFVEAKRARTLAGAMGSVAMGFELKDGKPVFTVYDPRWCIPTFKDKSNRQLERLEIRYPYKEMIFSREENQYVDCWFWYRRVITELSDEIWERVPIDIDGQEPDWQSEEYERQVSLHRAGRCPVEWIQNEYVDASIDGDPDCHGAFELIEQYDMLMAQANRGIVANCDPTRVITSDDEFPSELQFGSNAAIQVEKGGSVNYLELNGTGPRAAREQAADLRERIYEMVAYVPDDSKEAPQQTAFQVGTRFTRMLERADTFRTQYGEALTNLLDIALKVCRSAMEPRRNEETGAIHEAFIDLPRRFDEETKQWIEEDIGTGGQISIAWPPYFKPTLDDLTKASTAVSTLVTAQIITAKDAIEIMRKFIPLRDAELIAKELEAAETAVDEQVENGVRGKVRGALGV